MADLFNNPMGLMGFEFVEFASATKGVLEPVFERMGFTLVAKHRSKDVVLYRQGGINFIVNREPKSVAGYFAAEHGPSACGMAFRVKDSHHAYRRALELGAQPIEIKTGPMELNLPAIKGIGGAPLYLIDRFEDGESIYDIDFKFIDGVDRHPVGHGLKLIDHLTHNVYRGRMAFWADFYERLFNFREIRFFDIKGEYTGLTSKVLTAPDGKIRIPLNEESRQGGGQIEEYLMKFNGEGIQHIALICDDLLATVDKLALAGVPLMTAPSESYYEMLKDRLPGHGQPVAELQTRGILMDGTTEEVAKGGGPRLLLQIFSQAQLGPVFFEFIQRKGDEGFGEGNFKALFESLERDQVKRGVIEAKHGLAAGDAQRPARVDWTIDQAWAHYSAAEHGVWKTLFERQSRLLPGRACDAFVQGMADLPIGPEQIPDFRHLSDILMARTGWQVVAVPGLVPDEVFFEHLANRRFPAGQFIRQAHELDYIDEPDVFHDVFGHVPLLLNPAIADYIQAYGVGGLRAQKLGVLDQLARVYWYTIEFGLVQQPDGLRIYGAGIASSAAESVFALDNASPNRVRFDLERVMRTRYRIDDFQETYFVIDGLDQLLKLARIDFSPLYARVQGQPEYEPGTVLASDRVISKGTGRYHAAKR